MLGEAGRCQTAVTDSGVQRAQNCHDACSEGNRNADLQNGSGNLQTAVFYFLTDRHPTIVPVLIDDHVAKRDHRTDGDAQNSACGSLRQSPSGMHQHRGNGKTRNDLEKDLQHLVHRGRDHIPVALTVSAVRGDQTDQQDRRCHGPHAQCRIRFYEIGCGKPLVPEKHDQREDHTDRRKGHDRSAEGFFLQGLLPAGVRLRNQSGKCNGQSGRGEREENVIDVISRKEDSVTVVPENIPKRDLIDRAEQLHDHNTDGKNRRAVHEVLFFSARCFTKGIGRLFRLFGSLLHRRSCAIPAGGGTRRFMLASDRLVSASHDSVSIIRRAT